MDFLGLATGFLLRVDDARCGRAELTWSWLSLVEPNTESEGNILTEFNSTTLLRDFYGIIRSLVMLTNVNNCTTHTCHIRKLQCDKPALVLVLIKSVPIKNVLSYFSIHFTQFYHLTC